MHEHAVQLAKLLYGSRGTMSRSDQRQIAQSRVRTSQPDEQQIARIFRQMGEPSWWVLSQLHPINGMAGVEIIRAVGEALQRAGSPIKRLDPSTFTRGI